MPPTPTTRLLVILAGVAVLLVAGVAATFIALAASATPPETATPPKPELPTPAPIPRVQVSADRSHFVLSTGERFTPWGFNYLGLHDHLAEEDWHTPAGWARIEKDFREMKALGANVVRWHLQFETFMTAPDRPKPDQLARLRQLLDLARDTGLYLDLTGLNCFRLSRTPDWYDGLPEGDRWAAQAVFWEAVAGACAGHPAVWCYNLMNEPVIGEPKPGEHPWLTGKLGEFHFVQRVSRRPAGPDRDRVAEAWVTLLVQAVRKHDREALVTVGEIPWSQVWPTAKPVFYTAGTAAHLDFVSVHLYPGRNQLEKDVAALAAYDIGKPLVVEETFPLNCTLADMDAFMDATAGTVDGWIGHYFGATAAEHRAGKELADHLKAAALDHWQRKGATVLRR